MNHRLTRLRHLIYQLGIASSENRLLDAIRINSEIDLLLKKVDEDLRGQSVQSTSPAMYS